MKWIARIFLSLTWIFLFTEIYAQEAPQGIYYQAVARGTDGNELIEEPLSLRINLLDEDGTIYTELHSETTDQYGLFELVIGSGTVESGSFSSISWGTEDHFLNVELDLGDGYVDVSTTQLLSVPYSLYAQRAATADNVDDADANPTNEIVESFSVNEGNLELTESGNLFSIPISDIANDGDWNINSENQTLTTENFNVGVNTTTPSSLLTINGSVATNVVTIDSDPNETIFTSIGINNCIVICDVVNGSISVSLPPATESLGRIYMLKRLDSSSTTYSANSDNQLTLEPINGETIDNKTDLTLDSNDFEQVSLVSDGQNWFVLSYSTNP